MFEMVRYGQFQDATSDYFDVGYVTAWNAVLTLFGLHIAAATRKRIHLH